jgi:hypothetical protein
MRRLSIAAVAALCLVFAATAPAAKKASSSQVKAITKAIQTTSVGDFSKIDTDQYVVKNVKISTKSKNWATADTVPAKGFENKFQSGYAILINPAGTKGWTVVDLGSALVGCGIAPDSVIKDLTGNACPKGEGVDN